MASTALSVALTTPHAGMPMFGLTAEERANVISYVLSLHALVWRKFMRVFAQSQLTVQRHCRASSVLHQWSHVARQSALTTIADDDAPRASGS